MSSRPRMTAVGLVAVLGGVAVLAPLASVPARAAADHVLINEVYGGGGNSGATLKNDFVELYNPTTGPISLAGWTVNYYSAAGTTPTACNLSGTAAAGSYFLVQQAAGTGGSQSLPAPDAACNAAMSATAGRVTLVDAAGATVDLVGYGATAKPYEGTGPAPTLSNTTSASRTNFVDTDNNAADFTAGAPTPRNSADGGETPSPTPTPTATPTPSLTTIAQIQGTGDTSPLVGRTVTTQGVVTAVYPTGGFDGFYLQTPGTGSTPKKAGDASDGIFVYGSAAVKTVQAGQCYTVTGKVSEYNRLTELGSPVVTPADGCAPVTATDLATLPVTDADREAYEGMLVRPLGSYTITNNYQLNQYGQLGLAVGDQPLRTATDVVTPDKAAAYEAENLKKYITLDDGSSWDYLNNATAKNSPLPYLSQDEPMRTGSHLTFDKPVILDYRYQWNYQPTGQIVGATDDQDPVASQNDRETTSPAVGGDVRIATFNVLNYFTDLGKDEAGCAAYNDRAGTPVATNNCQVRGAYTQQAFDDQQAKIVTAINRLGADIVSLEEIETSSAISYLPGQDRDTSLAILVAALNKAGGHWAYVPSPRVVPSNQDVIRTAFIYNVDRVQLNGPSQILLDPAFANARQPLAQKFKLRKAGSPFVVIANHFKSKSSGDDDGTGQGLSNPSRMAQAKALTGWVTQVFGGEAVFLVGDFNAYSKEDPVRVIEQAGYTNLAEVKDPTATTYQYSGRMGSLDHAFANAKAQKMVIGAGVWDINADESIAMQYSRRNYNATDFYTTEPYAASDHDPLVVGLKANGAKG